MKTTSVTNAVERLKKRTGNLNYKAIQANGLFYLVEKTHDQRHVLSPTLPAQYFVAFVNMLHAEPTKPLSQNEQHFQEKIRQAQTKR